MIKNLKTGLAIALAGFSTLLLPATSRAAAYASKLVNTGSAIRFLLNEPAVDVKIIYNAGASTLDLGALAKGSNTANVVVTGTYKVQVLSSNASGYFQSSDDNNNFCKYPTRAVSPSTPIRSVPVLVVSISPTAARAQPMVAPWAKDFTS